jgi:transposase
MNSISGIIIVTKHRGDIAIMPTKKDALKDSGNFNRQFARVIADIFKIGMFFDARDIVQVKYEMLRAVEKDGENVTTAAKEFGFSRKTYYQAVKAFNKGGLDALVPKKTGPKGPNKLHGNVSEYINSYVSANLNAGAKEIAAQMEKDIGIKVHKRTIERYLKKN